jgi:hypothetical protein
VISRRIVDEDGLVKVHLIPATRSQFIPGSEWCVEEGGPPRGGSYDIWQPMLTCIPHLRGVAKVAGSRPGAHFGEDALPPPHSLGVVRVRLLAPCSDDSHKARGSNGAGGGGACERGGLPPDLNPSRFRCHNLPCASLSSSGANGQLSTWEKRAWKPRRNHLDKRLGLGLGGGGLADSGAPHGGADETWEAGELSSSM